MQKGLMIILSAPSGCGKGTILEKVREQRTFFTSISATTRSPRPGEAEGVNYYYLSEEDFKRKIADGTMLEHAEFCGNMYGTPRDPVDAHIEKGEDVILEIEVKGAKQVKEKCPEAVLVFVLPPSIAELRARLTNRGTESHDVIERRVAKAAEEIPEAKNYDYVIVNDDLDTAVEEFIKVMDTEKLAAFRRHSLIDEVLSNKGDN